MADLSNHAESAFAEALRGGGNGTNITAPSALYVKLHTGDPGEAGTSNASAETDRKEIEFGANSGGVITSSGDVEWTAWDAGSETISHISIWDDPSAGNCWLVGDLAAPKSVSNGDTFRLASGDVTITIA